MKMYNGGGGISKASGNRRRPYCARITTGWSQDPETGKKKQHQKVIGYYRTRKEALEALVEYGKHPYDLEAANMTFDDIYQKLEFPANERNYKNAYRYLVPVQNKSIRTIKPADLQDCIDACHTTQQPLIKTICKRVYNYAMMHEYTDRDISQFIVAHAKDAEIERVLFTHDEIEELWTMTEYWWAKTTLILLYTGLRTKELRTTPIEYFNMDEKWFDIPLAKNKCSVRGIPLHDRILPLISDYIEHGGNLYNYSHASLNKALGEFHGHRAHDCRHTFTTKMRECGVDHVTIQRLVGHTPSDITYKVYTHISKEELQKAIQKLVY